MKENRMSEKLTKQKIDQMIKDLLQEKTINVGIKSPETPNETRRKEEAGALGTPKAHAAKDKDGETLWAKIRKLAALRVNKSAVDDPDFPIGLSKGKNSDEFQAAVYILQNTTNEDFFDHLVKVVGNASNAAQNRIHKIVSSKGTKDFANTTVGKKRIQAQAKAATAAKKAQAQAQLAADTQWLNDNKSLFPTWDGTSYLTFQPDGKWPEYVKNFDDAYNSNPIKYITSWMIHYADENKTTLRQAFNTNHKIVGIFRTDIFADFFRSNPPGNRSDQVVSNILDTIRTNGSYDLDKVKSITNFNQYDNKVEPNLKALERAYSKTTEKDRLGVQPDLDILVQAIGDKKYIDKNGTQANLIDAFKKLVFNNDQQKIKKIAGLMQENTDNLEPQDFDLFYDFALQGKKNFSQSDAEGIVRGLKKFYKLIPDNELELKNVTAAVIKYYRQTDDIRTSKGTLSGYNITSRSASGAKIDAQVLDAFATAFDGQTFKERMEQFNNYANEVSKFIQSDGNIAQGEGIDKKFAKFITFDLMQQILYSFEASSAGWVYESFLAFMAHGRAIGASYGAGDFTIQNSDGTTAEGSAKLLQTEKSEQNIENVNDGDIIRYVVGVKRSIAPKTTEKDQAGRKIKTPQDMGTAELIVYIFDIKKINGKMYADNVGQVTDQSQELTTNKEGTRMNIVVPENVGPIGVIDLIFLQQEEFEDYSGLIVRDISDQLEKSMLYMSEMKSNIDDYVLNYSDQDDKDFYSKEAIKNHTLLKQSLIGTAGTPGLFVKESKLQSLDNLIAETLRDIKRKRKK